MESQKRLSLSPARFAVLNAGLCSAAIGFLVWLIYFHEGAGSDGPSILPMFSAIFNSISACLLLGGLWAIRHQKRRLHQQLMLSALLVSALFLVNYIYYHYSAGDTYFLGTGFIRPVYFVILISHVVLSVVILPMILTAIYLALSDRLALHKRFARWTWGGWMYVSVTGVVVYFMLHVITWT
ncbi:MAG: hypothetical protein CL917_17370 [Deltaproteobacteria bacterium]|nr:hypothetical protein [Deltaproteobacteria bacterium]